MNLYIHLIGNGIATEFLQGSMEGMRSRHQRGIDASGILLRQHFVDGMMNGIIHEWMTGRHGHDVLRKNVELLDDEPSIVRVLENGKSGVEESRGLGVQVGVNAPVDPKNEVPPNVGFESSVGETVGLDEIVEKGEFVVSGGEESQHGVVVVEVVLVAVLGERPPGVRHLGEHLGEASRLGRLVDDSGDLSL